MLIYTVFVSVKYFTISLQDSGPLPSVVGWSVTSSGYDSQSALALAHSLAASVSRARAWLEKLQQNVSLVKSAPPNIIAMVAALFVTSTSKELTEASVLTLVEIAKIDHSQVFCYSFF